ncbi:hypothetical protein BDV96DRAFT_577312 [Lophiotrema nucula]|uniref:F-box domain-containing protein n=1 Tax=Lophiotrema nucula TaxID=690887 RepID=A0A6A5Z4K0_9PLEO|nr:hypothetical protein BDV96DRAFT_577312 [Lophiotrema nucula]
MLPPMADIGTRSPTLLSLPNELLLHISKDVLPDSCSLFSLSLTSRRMSEIGQEALVSDCLVSVRRLPKLVDLIFRKSNLARGMRSLRLCRTGSSRPEDSVGPIHGVFRAIMFRRIARVSGWESSALDWLQSSPMRLTTELIAFLLMLAPELREVKIDPTAFDLLPFFAKKYLAPHPKRRGARGQLYRGSFNVVDTGYVIGDFPLTKHSILPKLERVRIPCGSVLTMAVWPRWRGHYYTFLLRIRSLEVTDCSEPPDFFRELSSLLLDKQTCPTLKSIDLFFDMTLRECLNRTAKRSVNPSSKMWRLA